MEKILLAVMVLTLAACSGNKETDNRTRITVAIEPLRYITEAIAGNGYKVEALVPSGTSPETYDPTPNQLVALNHSKAYFEIGHIGFEMTTLPRLKSNTPNLKFYNTSEGIDLVKMDVPHEHHEGEHHHYHAIDPHIWSSTSNVKIIAENICSALCEMDTPNAEQYKARKDSLLNDLELTDQQIKETLKHGSKAFIIYHPALTYFARDYGLKQICIEKNGKEPTPANLLELIEQGKKDSIKTVFVQKEFNSSQAEIIAKELEARIVYINPLSYDVKKELLNIAKAMN